MIINENQLARFSRIQLEHFIVLTIEFLRSNFSTWAQGKDEEQLRGFITNMVDWAARYGIHSGLNLQKLLHHKIVFGWTTPLHEKLEALIGDPDQPENYRVENFCLSVASGRYKLIPVTLETDLPAPAKKTGGDGRKNK